MEEFDVVVIGAGAAGVTAAIYAARQNLKTLLIEKGLIGGEIAQSGLIENYPGFKGIQGIELAQLFEDHLRKFVSNVWTDEVVDIQKLHDGSFKLKTAAGKEVHSRAVIICTGAEYRLLGIPGEKEFKGKGVSYCTYCDGPLFRGKTVAVVGGGNTAVDAAIYLAGICKKVYILHRRDEFRAEKILQERLDASGVEKLLSCVPVEIQGDKSIKKLKYKDLKSGKEKLLDVDGVFIHIGAVPASALAKKIGVEIDANGYIKTDVRKRTNVKFFYTAGDLTGILAQISVAVGEGTLAAIAAYDDLMASEK